MPESIEAAWLREQWRANPSLINDFDGRWIAVRGTEIVGAHERLAALIRDVEGPPPPQPGGQRGGPGTPVGPERGPGGRRGPLVGPEVGLERDTQPRWLPGGGESAGGLTESRGTGTATVLAHAEWPEDVPFTIRPWHGEDVVLQSYQQVLAEVQRRRRMRADAAARPLYAFVSRRPRA
ncbi:MAG TPA: hypothetical protein VHQ45_06980 [Gemmatimonadaceae bacterium]|nr:hypothetical protein [Gemmatimonadaceae bacterium]